MAAAEVFPRTRWRKKRSQKGKARLKILHPSWKKVRRTPKPSPLSSTRKASVSKPRKKKTTEGAAGHDAAVPNQPVRRRLDLDEEAAGDDGGGADGGNPPLVRRRLDMDDGKIGSGGAPLCCFNRAMLMDNLRSLAKLALSDGIKKQKPPLTLALPKKIDLLPSYSRAQLVDNLMSLAAKHNIIDTSTTSTAADGLVGATVTKANNKKKAMRVAKLVLRAYKSKQQRAAAIDEHEHAVVAEDDDPIAMALVVRNESVGTELAYVPRWEFQSVAVPDAKTLRQLVRITPAIEAAYNELVRSDETCLGDDLDSVPEGPELEAERRRLEVLVDKFMGPARAIIGKREFANWKGSVLTSVIGTFLTQNVADVTSSNVFMNMAAMFSFVKNESNTGQSTDVTLITDGCDSGVSERLDNERIDQLIASLRTGEISNWDKDKERIKGALKERLEDSTAKKIAQDIKSFLQNDTSCWKYLLDEAYKNGYRKEETNETIDWETLLHASFGEIEECLKDRGTYSYMAFRILLLLIRIKRDHGSIDLEWLRYIPRAKAKKFLQSIIGIGYKSVDCIRLLSLRHRGFPVDVNVARIVTRLGWVPLQPLGDSIEFHMVDKEPVMAKIQEYLEPLLSNIPSHKRYELHCQQITFAKVNMLQKSTELWRLPIY